MSGKPLTAAIVGAGHRSVLYASLSKSQPEKLQVVAVAEPDDTRRNKTAADYGLAPESCFLTAEEMAAQPALADVAINGTMDRDHVPTTLPLLERGYDVLLEKPIAPTREELLSLVDAVKRTGRKVVVCHVLRYAPFYVAIRERIAAGEIGDVVSMSTAENVSYHHMAVGFVRGKWNRHETSNPMLMAKCCHDLDLITWMKSGIPPARVSSFGGIMHFKPEMAPEGAGTRCLVDCEIEDTCDYSAKKHYIDMGIWGYYAWECIEHLGETTEQQRIESLKTDNPLGRCVWHSDNTVVDHQCVGIEFEDGCTATHTMTGGTSKPCRSIHVIGTKGEIQGTMEDGSIVVRRPDARKGHEFIEEPVDLNASRDMHGGGDMRLVEDFLRVVRGEPASLSTTDLMDSVNGHMIAFAADLAMNERRTVEISELL